MTDEDILTVLRGLVRESPDLGVTPRARILEYLDRTAPTIENGARPAEKLLRGDDMITWEGPRALFDRLVLHDRLYRTSHARSV